MDTPMLVARSFDMMPLRFKDAGVMFSRWLTDKEVAKYCTWSPLKDAKEAQDYVSRDIQRNTKDDYYSWGMYFDDFSHGANRPRLFGHVTLKVNWELRLGTLGYNLMRSEWGKGFATEAVNAVLPFAFGVLELKYVNAACHADNRASGRVLEKAGFTKQYEFQSPWKTGGKAPMVRYQMTSDQYFAEDEDDDTED